MPAPAASSGTPVDPRDGVLGELDLALVHALQVDARAPWARIGATIGVDASTAARRWAALVEARSAWFTVWPSTALHAARSDAALVRLPGRPSSAEIERWCAAPWTLSVESTSAGLLVVAVGHGGLGELDAKVNAVVHAGPPDATAVVEYAAAAPLVDSQWELRVLSEAQVRRLARPRRVGALRRVEEAMALRVTELLGRDARMPYAALAAELDVSEATAGRWVERLVGNGWVRVGVDVAMPAVGLGRGVVLRADTVYAGAASPDPVIDPVGWSGGFPPEVHRVLHVVGPAPLVLSCRMPSLTGWPSVEAALDPRIRVVDRWTVLEVHKRNGHLLGRDGRSTGAVPLAW